MDESGNQLDDDGDIVSRILEQGEIDETNMKNLSDANRLYRKCVSGKCPQPIERRSKQARKTAEESRKKPTKLVSSKRQDKFLSKLWVEKGRDHRWKVLENELKELDTKITVATAKHYLTDHEKNFKAISETIKDMELMDEQIKKAKLEISHIKSQFPRLQQKKDELSKETESEDKFANHLRKANRQLEIYEGRVQTSRQHECMLITENYKLRNLIESMLCDRAVFNSYWSKIVNKLKDRRKFLLDMIERSNQAFNQGADFLDSIEKHQSRRTADRNFHISQMINMERQIDANQIMNMFLGGKGKKRVMTSLEPREVRRRDNFKYDYTERLNLYTGIIENIKKFTGIPDIQKSTDYYLREENDGFQFYNYLNEMNHQIGFLSYNYFKLSTGILASQDYNTRKLKFFDERIDDLRKQFRDEINKTLQLKNDRDMHENEIAKYLDAIMDILKVLNCDLSSVQKLLGNHNKVTVFNVSKFFSLLEQRTNEVLAHVYCGQRKSVDLLNDDSNLIVKSLKRVEEEPVKIEDIITTQQCAECAEGEDVNRYDDKIVYPLDHETIKANMRKKVEAPQMAYRLHNLSKCNLPRSGIIAGRRYAE